MKNKAMKDALLKALKRDPDTVIPAPRKEGVQGAVPLVTKTKVQLRPRGERAPMQPRPSRPQPQRSAAKPSVRSARAETEARKFQQEVERLSKTYEPSKKAAEASEQAGTPPWRLEFSSDPTLGDFLMVEPVQVPLLELENDGISRQAPGKGVRKDVRGLVLGIDFGTSCVKAIVGDVVTEDAFAVPFLEAEGIDRYLLPSRVYEAGVYYDLSDGDTVHRNLKLALLEEIESSSALEKAVAFLALVMRRVRGWLFTEHRDVYRGVEVAWRLRLGIPTEHYWAQPDSVLESRFRRVAWAAWICSCYPELEITSDNVQRAIRRAEELTRAAPVANEPEDIEVEVIPELAAQIFGFLKSDQFGNAKDGRFMLVDVGAGTIDSSVFQVVRAGRGKWDFKFFTTLVLQNGAANLHRSRLQWWIDALLECGSDRSRLVQGLRDALIPTDLQTTIPGSFREYVRSVKAIFAKEADNPDHRFFRLRVLAQVRGKTLWRCREYLDSKGLAGTPMFLCGGGSRMEFYRELNSEMQSNTTGVTWLYATPRTLALPETLRAEGVMSSDYDRLSVAYGLSFLEVGKVFRGTPQPTFKPLPPEDRPDRDDLWPK